MLASCSADKNAELDHEGTFFHPPIKVELNTEEGYGINPVSGDSIAPIINYLGDTVITGIPRIVKGRMVDPSTVVGPRRVDAGKPDELRIPMNVRNLPEMLRTVPVQTIDLLNLPGGADQASFVLLNSTGDTLSSGIPVPVKGKVVPFVQPEPVTALPPGMKDNASVDIKYLDVYHHLFSSQVLSIVEDPYGQLWFSTTGGGASIYDGRSFLNVTAEEGLCESWILSSMKDSQNRLWFGTMGEGVIRFNGEEFLHFTEEEGLSNNVVSSLLEDSRGNIWFGTDGGGLCRFDGQYITCFTTREGLSSNWILSMTEDRRGDLWIGTTNGVCRFDGERFSYLPLMDKVNLKILHIVEDRQGNLWFASEGAGVMKYDGTHVTYFTEREGLSNNIVNTILEDSQERLWFGTTGGGASILDGNTFTHITEKEGLSGNWVTEIIEDRSGKLWLGTVGGGVSIYTSNSFRHYTEESGLSSRGVYSIMEDSREELWFGTMFGGASLYDGNTMKNFSMEQGLSDQSIESMLEDSQGRIWFGTARGGVSMYDGQTFTHYTGETGFSDLSVGSILEDRHGNLWFGTFGGGVINFDGKQFTHFTETEGLSNNLVEAMMEDSHGRIWFGSLGGGVSMYDGEFFTHFSEKEGLSSNLIGCMLEDRQGNIWFGTMTSGVSRFDGQTFLHFTEEEGLNENLIQSIQEDRQGNIWLATEDGLNMIGFEDGVDSIRIYSFGLQDGLKGTNFIQNSVQLDSRNRLWWGTNKSLTMLDMNGFQIERKSLKTYLRRIDLNGQLTDFRHLDQQEAAGVSFDSVAGFFNYPFNLVLPYNKNHLTFHFSALDLESPHQTLYSYRMEGLNNSWSLPTLDTKAEYRNLSYGTHTFQVRANGAARIWGETLEYTFTITPPWWQTWYMRIAYAIILILVVFGLVRWRTSRLTRHQKELERTVEDRTIEISEMNEELKQQNQNLAEQRQAITDSIEYARRIQTATLPPDEVLRYLFPKHFILYKPLQIVSGDFYWLTQKKGKIIVAVADCTGHGVPGAFMSMLGSALLSDIVNNMTSLKANLILNELRDRVIVSLRQTGEADEARDGMDIALCVIDQEQMELQYAGAHHPLYLVREGELTEIKADPMPIGISSEAGKSFTNHALKLRKDDTLYLFSDGYADQVGGEKRKRFMTSRFKSLLLDIQDRIMFDQKAVLESTLQEWMGIKGSHGRVYEQIDDIVVMGIKV
jgi:ligand-binding sensor domain-containing protein/serine phosphatase RsbU (regulator of sigma subunit)